VQSSNVSHFGLKVSFTIQRLHEVMKYVHISINIGFWSRCDPCVFLLELISYDKSKWPTFPPSLLSTGASPPTAMPLVVVSVVLPEGLHLRAVAHGCTSALGQVCCVAASTNETARHFVQLLSLNPTSKQGMQREVHRWDLRVTYACF
jgi:hypothetical protein